jgi:hypothetical protein
MLTKKDLDETLSFVEGQLRRVLEEPVVTEQLETIDTLRSDNQILRKMLWFRHGCPSGALYGDDGEMQCAKCFIDFKRLPVEDIRQRFQDIGVAKLAKALKEKP